MKMIDVLNMMAKGEIKEGAKLKIGYKIYDYIKDYTESENCSFVNQEDDRIELLEDNEFITTDFLNYDVELIPPKPKKYLIKLNIKWLKSQLSYVIYYNDGPDQHVIIGNKVDNFGSKELGFYRAYFTEQELQSIQPVREFLDDMQGKFELIEVDDNE